MRLQPDEAIYMKIVVKQPGLEMQPVVSEMDLSYKHRYQGANIPDAYERLILDAIRGDQQHFVRRCVVVCMVAIALWAIFRHCKAHISRNSSKQTPTVCCYCMHAFCVFHADG